MPFQWYNDAKKKDKKAFPYGRNIVLLSVVASHVAMEGGGDIIPGFTAIDVTDASPEFVKAFNRALKFGIDYNKKLDKVKVIAPLNRLDKAKIIEIAKESGRMDVIEKSWSCYEGKEKHCGKCSACIKRKEAFQILSITDPTEYDN